MAAHAETAATRMSATAPLGLKAHSVNWVCQPWHTNTHTQGVQIQLSDKHLFKTVTLIIWLVFHIDWLFGSFLKRCMISNGVCSLAVGFSGWLLSRIWTRDLWQSLKESSSKTTKPHFNSCHPLLVTGQIKHLGLWYMLANETSQDCFFLPSHSGLLDYGFESILWSVRSVVQILVERSPFFFNHIVPERIIFFPPARPRLHKINISKNRQLFRKYSKHYNAMLCGTCCRLNWLWEWGLASCTSLSSTCMLWVLLQMTEDYQTII